MTDSTIEDIVQPNRETPIAGHGVSGIGHTRHAWRTDGPESMRQLKYGAASRGMQFTFSPGKVSPVQQRTVASE